jgi:hypothetical protein
MKILLLLKKNSNNYAHCKAGLLNSATFVKQYLEQLDINCSLRVCDDSNSIDKEIHHFRPDICILEAIWFTPDKMRELTRLHPNVKFIVRIHSEIPFLAQEGMAFSWISEFVNINNVHVSFNSVEACKSMERAILQKDFLYLPNVYVKADKPSIFQKLLTSTIYWFKKVLQYQDISKTTINVGCFGAIRPFKNQLAQIVAAIAFANRNALELKIHINSTRAEQGGENVLKNIRALFNMTPHKLVEHQWLDHDDFLSVVKQMDIGMQVSFTESFNIVAADFISQQIPIITSPAVRWMPHEAQADPISHEDMIAKMTDCFYNTEYYVCRAEGYLFDYNEAAKLVWKNFIDDHLDASYIDLDSVTH